MKKRILESFLQCRSVTLISAFSNESADGGGWVSRRIFGSIVFNKLYIRSGNVSYKIFYAIVSWIINPFLHPIFARYTPPHAFLYALSSDVLILNHSQTFAAVLFHKNAILICHDLQFHRSSFFWVRWSERILLRRAVNIVVLSDRDAMVLNVEYLVSKERIINVFPDLVEELVTYSVQPNQPLRKFVFLGSLDRDENREGIKWFINNVAKKIHGVSLSVIGRNHSAVDFDFPGLNLIDYVENLEAEMDSYDACIAPMFSPAGVKIKVLDYLRLKKIVIGTEHSFSGFPCFPEYYISNNAKDWIDIIDNPKRFSFIKTE